MTVIPQIHRNDKVRCWGREPLHFISLLSSMTGSDAESLVCVKVITPLFLLLGVLYEAVEKNALCDDAFP
jgi:hypothetical protein